MSDNTIQLKVSVDTSELDKLEEQLNRIKQLMQDLGVKVNIKPEQGNDYFIAGSGQYFMKDAVIDGAKLKCCVSGDAVFSGVLVSNKSELDTKAQPDNDVISQIKQNAIAIAELDRAMQASHQAWSEAVNRTWCSQR
ncbi:hypothetical protein F9282_06705 [Proteus terrae subsp. cibarius]|uniref:Uncharacterized protein n=1 Tax=Proteus terrae subsp. cibarius TaxID=626774 RepID=A0ABX6JR40_9GAMM|nr:hypothetical protein [Proteus terrae]QGW02691.1 hypothetical protein F9282_06705 [Proteus terrae subsp. cibarius]QIF90295.1 hypothetical protein GTH23_09710 [Proteus terrae subsp. cibarius]